MPFPSALTTDQYETLRGTSSLNPSYAASEYAIFCPNTVIFKALVNGAPTGTSYAQISFDNVTTGAYTDIVVGQTVLIGSDSDIRNATFLGRVRKAPTSSILYINETSESILDNANIWVIQDFRVWDRLARQVGATQYKDWDVSYTTPAPFIYNLQSAYAGVASGSPEKLTLSFAPFAQPITSGATINGATWVWTVPSGMTITIGSSTTQNITAEFDAGFADWVSVQVNDSNGKTGVFHFFVGVASSDLSNVVNLNIVPGGNSGDENGWTASVEAFDGIDTMLDNTLVVLFDVEYYNGTQTSILSNVKLVGRIRKETDNTVSDTLYSQLKKATLEIEGSLAQFSRIEHLPFTLINDATPSKFDELKDLTLWRAIAYTLYWHSTYLTLHSLTFDSVANTFLYLALPTQGGNILSVIQDLAVSNNSTLESAPQGETRVYRNGVYLSGAQRAALVTVANFDTRDLINIDSISITEVDTTGKIQGSGGFYNSVSGKVTPLLSLAPGVAQGIGEGISTFSRQVLQANVTQATAQAELNTRTGHEFAAKRAEGTYLTATIPPGYNWLVPSRSQWYTWTLDTSDTTGGRAYTTADRWQLFSVSYQHDNAAGTKSPIQATFKLETSGSAGQTVTYPAQTTIPPIIPTVPTVPSFPTYPPPPEIILPPDPSPDDTPPYNGGAAISNGNIVVIWSASQVWICDDLFYTSTPSWREITPDGATNIVACKWAWNGSQGLYVLTDDNTDSAVYFTTDGISPNPTYSSVALTGLYTVLRVTSTAGGSYVYSADSNTVTINVPGTQDEPGINTGLYVTVGQTVTCSASGLWGYNAMGPIFGPDGDTGVTDPDALLPSADVMALIGRIGTSGSWELLGSSGSFVAATSGYLYLIGNDAPGDFGNNSGSVTAVIAAGGGANAQTAYSPDYAGSYATPVNVGSAPTAGGGLDVAQIGAAVLAAGNGQVYIATTAGGSYSAYGSTMPSGGQPSCIIAPYYRFNTTTSNNATSTPQYLVSSLLLTGSNESTWRVTSSGGTFTDVTPSVGGVYGKAVGANSLAMPWKSGAKIAAVFDFDGDRKLLTSTNAGTGWTNRGALNAFARYVSFRRTDITNQQLFIANGTAGVMVSPSFGSNLIPKTAPTDDAIIGIEPF